MEWEVILEEDMMDSVLKFNKHADVGEWFNPPDLRQEPVKGEIHDNNNHVHHTKGDTQDILGRETSGLQGIPAGSNPAISTYNNIIKGIVM